MNTVRNKFPSPFDIEAPTGCDEWKQFYPYYHTFSSERRDFEEQEFWFFDGMHHPEPLHPFDSIIAEAHWVGLSQYNTRVFMIPSALGIDQRIVNGYLYMSPNTITDPDVIQDRVALFRKRAGYYFQNWDDLYQKWQTKAEAHIKTLNDITVQELPDIEHETVVTEGLGVTSANQLLEAYNRVIENLFTMWSYHFEMLNLGYVAYLTFIDFCKKVFPDITDQSMAKMVAGVDSLLFRPDDELRKLAHLAVKLGITDVIRQLLKSGEDLSPLSKTEEGQTWLEALEAAKEPWFNFSSGTGFYHQHRSWVDDMSIPLTAICSYIKKLENGENIERPLAENQAEQQRVASEYRALLDHDEERKTFDELLGLARKVFPYVEDHNFFVEHWHHTIFWKKIRQFGDLLVKHGFVQNTDDIFFLNRYEIQSALYDLVTGWAVGTAAKGPGYWPKEIDKRKAIFEKLRQWSPPPCLGVPPDVVTDPFMIMLWGITSDTIQHWLGSNQTDDNVETISGCGASPGIVEGNVRVILRAEQLHEILPGEILVCPTTSPSWAPVFSMIQATVSDIGGIMCHAAIVSREYGLPAVVGTGVGSRQLMTGQRIRVDGSTGQISVLKQVA